MGVLLLNPEPRSDVTLSRLPKGRTSGLCTRDEEPERFITVRRIVYSLLTQVENCRLSEVKSLLRNVDAIASFVRA